MKHALGAVGIALAMATLMTLCITINLYLTGDLPWPTDSPTTLW